MDGWAGGRRVHMQASGWVDGRRGWAGGWVSDVVIRAAGNEKRHMGGVFFGWLTPPAFSSPPRSFLHLHWTSTFIAAVFFVDLLVLFC